MVVKIEFSNKLSTYLEPFKANKVVQILFSLRDDGTEAANLIEGDKYVNYLNLKDDFNISYIKTASIAKNNVTDPWHKSRQSCGVSQIIARILSNNYLNELKRTNKYQQTDIEELSAMIRADQMKDNTIELLRGFDILQAYNYTGKMNIAKISSCANFRQPKGGSYAEPKIKWFYPYIYNKNAGLIVVKDKNGNLKARVAYFEGIQQEDSGKYKKGEFVKFINNVYSEDTAYNQMIKDYCIANDISQNMNSAADTIVIPFKCKYKTWPPMDYVCVDVKNDLLFSKGNNFTNKYTIRNPYKMLQNGGNHSGKNALVIIEKVEKKISNVVKA